MIEGIATVSALNQNDPEVAQAKVDTPVETTPDVVEGKVNPVEDVEDPSNRSSSDENPGEKHGPTPDEAQGHIVDLLG
jgi:hypothetical protein